MKTAEEKRVYFAEWREKNRLVLREKQRAYYQANKAKIRAEARQTYRTDPLFRDKRLKNMYGIGVEQYDAMLVAQNGVCAICDKPGDGRLSIDHDHESGLVRGLLCHNCNKALGLLKDDVGAMRRAIEYLARSRRAC